MKKWISLCACLFCKMVIRNLYAENTGYQVWKADLMAGEAAECEIDT